MDDATPSGHFPRHRIVAGILLGVALLLGWFLWPPPATPPTTSGAHRTPASPTTATNAPDVARRLAQFESALRERQQRQEVLRSFQELRVFLDTATPEQAAAAIVAFLDTAADAPTGLGFVLKPDGSLTESPTLRVWLLDYLTQVDPAAAARYAERILATPGSADEWAVALRALARGRDTREGRALLQAKARQLVQHEPWQSDPSAGYLEAFDVFVHTRDTEFLPQLGNFLQRTNQRALAHAAYLALDRLLLAEPRTVLEQIVRQPDLMAGREGTRGNFVARADVSDPGQRQLVEEYLLDATRGVAELQAFSGTFPNANFMVSNNLLTQSPSVAGPELARRDRAALRVVEEWLADPRFERIKPQLMTMKRRLDEFTRQTTPPP